jgi:hypothetical protein
MSNGPHARYASYYLPYIVCSMGIVPSSPPMQHGFNGETPLVDACQQRLVAVVELLLKAGAEANNGRGYLVRGQEPIADFAWS